jgi:peroxiredoxin
MKWIATLTLAVCLGSPLFAAPPVLHKAGEFTITEASGESTLLSSHRGKVVIVQFLYTTCVHCQETARMLTKLHSEFGGRGLDVIGVAFNPEAQGRPEVVTSFTKANSVGFPVGTAAPDSVLSYLGVSLAERFLVPQIVVIDRKGMLRAKSQAAGSPELQDEAYLRTLVDGLLKSK